MPGAYFPDHQGNRHAKKELYIEDTERQIIGEAGEERVAEHPCVGKVQDDKCGPGTEDKSSQVAVTDENCKEGVEEQFMAQGPCIVEDGVLQAGEQEDGGYDISG